MAGSRASQRGTSQLTLSILKRWVIRNMLLAISDIKRPTHRKSSLCARCSPGHHGLQEEQAPGPAREAPQRRAARGGRLQAGLRRRQAAAAAAAAAAEDDSDEPSHDSDGEVTFDAFTRLIKQAWPTLHHVLACKIAEHCLLMHIPANAKDQRHVEKSSLVCFRHLRREVALLSTDSRQAWIIV